MNDETITPVRYRTGLGGRSLPLALAVGTALALPPVLIASGPFWWPWGLAAAAPVLAATLGFLGAWDRARAAVWWHPAEGRIDLVRGRSVRSAALADLTRVDVRPASGRTVLHGPGGALVLHHTLLGVRDLLDTLRAARPDLFPAPASALVFRVSGLGRALQLVLAVGTAAAGALVAVWSPVLALVLGAGALYALLRCFTSIPVRYEVGPGTLTVRYPWRVRRWGRPDSFLVDDHAAGGILFRRWRLGFGPYRVVLDESSLLDPLGPREAEATFLLAPEGRPDPLPTT